MPRAPIFHPTMQSPPKVSRRSFLKVSAVLAGTPLLAGVIKAQPATGKAPLMAYVGTFSSPLRAVLPILPDGRLGAATDIKRDGGTVGPKKATNAPPGSFAFSGHDRTHAHMIQADSSGRFILHVDLGLDRIFVWKFDERTGVLAPNDPP